MIVVNNNDITIAHVTSSAGDHFVRVYEGHLSDEAVKERVFKENESWWGSASDVYIEDIIYVRRA